jgi:penicillin-binding protein 2
MAQSCNVYFFDAAVRMGTAPLIQWSERLEFGRKTGVDLPFERSGTVPHPPGNTDTVSEAARKRFEREAPGIAIGQSRLTVTPLQMARLLAFVANGGWLVTPHVVSDEGSSRKVEEVDDAPRGDLRRQIPGISSETLDAIHQGLLAAVEDPTGTGFKTIRVPGVRIAGKTGTAESSPGKPDHAWFTGYFPAEQPKYVVVVALEHGGSGGRAAGPVVRELVRSMRDRGLLNEPDITHSEPARNAL